MAGYTITITPFDDESGPETIIRVDTSSGQPRVVELSVRAADGGGLSPGELPALNLDQMLAALTPTRQPVLSPAPSVEPSPQRRAAGTRRGAGATRGGRAAAQAPSRTRQARTAQARTAQTRTAQGRSAKANDQAARTSRAYRRMPDAEELVAAYRQAGGTTAVARHYGVPRHTATGWVRRLRRLGLLETPRRR